MRTSLAHRALVCTLLFGSACGSGSKDTEQSDDSATATGVSRVTGRLLDTDGRELGGVDVTIGKERTTTDSRGLFEAKEVSSGTQQVTVSSKKEAATQVSVQLRDKETTQVSLTTKPLTSVSIADAKAGGPVEHEGVRIRLPENALRKESGEVATGAAEGRYASLKEASSLGAAPGGMRAEHEGKEVSLETFGMVDVRFYQKDEALELDGEADLEFPLGPNSFAQGEQIDVWSFDESRGVWQREGKGTVDKSSGDFGTVKLKATHFSWWCAAQPIADTTCVSGTLQTSEGEALSNVQVNLTGVDYLANFSAYTDADGSFCVPVKSGSTNTLTSFGTDESSYFSWSSPDLVAGFTPAACGDDACTDVGTLMGESLFDVCTGNVTNDENHVLLLSSGQATPDLDAQVAALLESYGNSVTIGPQYTAFDGTVDLSDYDVVYLQANFNWASGDMPRAGQRQLVNWVNCGGGLVTVEWTVWKIGSRQFELLDSVYPTYPTTQYITAATSTYVQRGDDPTVHAGLPSSFTFTADSYAGSEIDLVARSGATVFYRSERPDPELVVEGVVGWDFNLGRVVSISTTGGPLEIADANYGRMVANVVDWLQRE